MIELIECMRTWQGEGPDTGKNMLLCRFKNCNRNCSFCDTKIQMNNYIEGSYLIERLQEGINKANGGLMITGGEPTLYNDKIIYILNSLYCGVCNIETNGFRLNELRKRIYSEVKKDRYINIKFIYSPKSSMENKNDFKSDISTEDIVNDPNIYVKLVIDEDTSINTKYISFLGELHDNGKNMQKVYLMPKGTTLNELKENSRYVMDLADKYQCNISTRMHLIYNFI